MSSAEIDPTNLAETAGSPEILTEIVSVADVAWLTESVDITHRPYGEAGFAVTLDSWRGVIGKMLDEGGYPDPVDMLEVYYKTTETGITDESLLEFKNLLGMAVDNPAFKQLDRYEAGRKTLADKLNRIGALTTDKMVVITKVEGNPAISQNPDSAEATPSPPFCPKLAINQIKQIVNRKAKRMNTVY